MSFKVVIMVVVGLLTLSGCYTKVPNGYIKKHKTFLIKADKLCSSAGGVFGYGAFLYASYKVKCYDGEIYNLFTEKPLINRIEINYRGSKDGE